jgi:hypothetical protein
LSDGLLSSFFIVMWVFLLKVVNMVNVMKFYK